MLHVVFKYSNERSVTFEFMYNLYILITYFGINEDIFNIYIISDDLLCVFIMYKKIKKI